MPKNLPESTRLAYARQLADEAKTLVPGMERLSAIAEELRADDLYRLLGFDTWERFCADYLGVSKRTANRWIAGPKKPASVGASDTDQPKSIGAGQSVAAGQNVPVVESKALNSAKSPEGLDQAGLHRAGQRADEPSGAVSANDPPTPSGPSSGGADVQPPAGPTGEAPTSPPSAPPDPSEYPVPGYVPEHVDVDAIGLRWLKSKTTREIRAIGDPWGPAIRAEVRRWAEAFGVAEPKRPGLSVAKLVQAGSTGPVPIPPPRYDLKPPPRNGAKRHALDCSCLGCKPAKAVGK